MGIAWSGYRDGPLGIGRLDPRYRRAALWRGGAPGWARFAAPAPWALRQVGAPDGNARDTGWDIAPGAPTDLPCRIGGGDTGALTLHTK